MNTSDGILLKSSLEVAVPLWIEAFRDYDWAELKRVMSDSEDALEACAEGILYCIRSTNNAQEVRGQTMKLLRICALTFLLSAIMFIIGVVIGMLIFG